jgi:K+-sensing histidine kinase KdpD
MRPAPDVRAALGVIVGSAGLLQEFHRGLGPEDIALLANGILEAAARLARLAGPLPPEAHPPHRRRRSEVAIRPSGYNDIRSAAKEAAFRDGRRADLQLDLEDIPISVPAAVVRRMVSELVHDALRISEHGTPVRVTLRAEGAGCRLEVGGGPQPTGRGRRRKLAAARRIAKATGGVLEVADRESIAAVRVRWPDAERGQTVRVRISS